jgi:glycosyltransferase involved in cell wall biosynthesis
MISFLVPCYNEATFIADTLETVNLSVRSVKIIDRFEVIIIDDGSSDNLHIKVKDLQLKFNNIIFAKNEKNMGMGYSIKKGIQLARYEKIIIIPGGNDIEIEALARSLKNYHISDLILQYPLNSEEREKHRNIISKIYSLIFIIFFDCNVYYINGCTIFPTKNLRTLKLKSNRHGLLSEIVTKLLREDITYCEIPIYYKWPHKSRKTVTLKNLFDVTKSFLSLLLELKIMNKTYVKSKRIKFFG